MFVFSQHQKPLAAQKLSPVEVEPLIHASNGTYSALPPPPRRANLDVPLVAPQGSKSPLTPGKQRGAEAQGNLSSSAVLPVCFSFTRPFQEGLLGINLEFGIIDDSYDDFTAECRLVLNYNSC